jgi:hypothetical protein
MKVRKKPVEVEAVRLGWDTWSEVCEFVEVGKLIDGKPEGGYIDPDGNFSFTAGTNSKMALAIPTLEGLMVATEGDWIIKGVKGEYYPCKPDIFEQTYDIVEEQV